MVTTPLLGKKDKADVNKNDTDTLVAKLDSKQDEIPASPSKDTTATTSQHSGKQQTIGATNQDEPAITEVWLGREKKEINREVEKEPEFAETVSSFQGFMSRISVDLGCSGPLLGISLITWRFLSSIIFIVPLYTTLLLVWSIPMGFMGGKYLTSCPMDHILPYIMMVTALISSMVLIVRIMLLLLMKYHTRQCLWQELKWVIRIKECVFLILIIFQLWRFYDNSPCFNPLHPRYCSKTFYIYASWNSPISITVVLLWILAYIINNLRCMKTYCTYQRI